MFTFFDDYWKLCHFSVAFACFGVFFLKNLHQQKRLFVGKKAAKLLGSSRFFPLPCIILYSLG